MTNVSEGTPLADLIRAADWKAPNLEVIDESIFGVQAAMIMAGYGVALDIRRMFFKGMGNILAKQERIAADFIATAAAMPPAAAVEP
jgi:hypothetical protein